jgi:hypothetical protein
MCVCVFTHAQLSVRVNTDKDHKITQTTMNITRKKFNLITYQYAINTVQLKM